MRISSSTVGFARRTSSVCHSEVTSARMLSSQSAASSAVSGRRSRRSSSCAIRRRFSSTVCRATSVGCAVNTGVITNLAQARRPRPRLKFLLPSCRSSVPRNEPGSGGWSRVQFSGAAAAFAVIGLGQIGQFEIRREGFGDLVGAGQIHLRDNFLRFEHEFGRRGLLRTAPRGLAMSRSASAASSSTESKSSCPDCSTSTCPRIAPSERTSRRRGLSFAGSSEGAVSSARRACWSSAFHSGLGLLGHRRV